MPKISKLNAIQVFDSRGNPTVCVETVADDGSCGVAMVPSGASTGKFEAVELRDKGKAYHGKGVAQACKNVQEKIQPRIIGIDIEDQRQLDALMLELDGTDNKSSLGANAILGVSLSVACCAANSHGVALWKYLNKKFFSHITPSLPTPMLNVVNGGAHANNRLDIQEFMLVPHKFDSYELAMQAATEIYQTLKRLIDEKNFSTAVGDEGGFAPDLGDVDQVISFLVDAIEKSGYKYQHEVGLALDCAATEYFSDGMYKMPGEKLVLNSEQKGEWLSAVHNKFDIVSFEDPFAEEDILGWKSFTSKLASSTQIVGDDVFVTQTKRFESGITDAVANSILIKVNQAGSLTETVDCILKAYEHNYSCVISHRSGETEDHFISDLAVACGAGQSKFGAPCRSERLSKYNRLLMISHQDRIVFAGSKTFSNLNAKK